MMQTLCPNCQQPHWPFYGCLTNIHAKMLERHQLTDVTTDAEAADVLLGPEPYRPVSRTLPDHVLLHFWQSVQGPQAKLNGPLIRFAGLVYRAAQDAPLERIQQLEQALRTAVKVAGEAYGYWDVDADSKVGKFLAALGGGLRGYRADIDAVHDALKGCRCRRFDDGRRSGTDPLCPVHSTEEQ